MQQTNKHEAKVHDTQLPDDINVRVNAFCNRYSIAFHRIFTPKKREKIKH